MAVTAAHSSDSTVADHRSPTTEALPGQSRRVLGDQADESETNVINTEQTVD